MTKEERMVCHKVDALKAMAKELFGVQVNPRIRFCLKGKNIAGRALGTTELQFHPYYLKHYTTDYIARTVIHEFAHAVVSAMGKRGRRPHGPIWKSVMVKLGGDPSRCHTYRMDEQTAKKTKKNLKKYRYSCGCRDWELTQIRHRRIMEGKRKYFCPKCGMKLMREVYGE